MIMEYADERFVGSTGEYACLKVLRESDEADEQQAHHKASK
jgi:hypothetical protein